VEPSVEAAPAVPVTVEAGMALQGLALVAAALALWPLCSYLVQLLFPVRRVHFARWGFSHVAQVAAALILCSLLFGTAAGALVELGRGRVFAGLVAQVLVYGAVTPLIGSLALRLDPDGLVSLGFRRGGELRACAAGVVAYGLMFPGYLGLQQCWPWLMERLDLEFELQEVAVGMLELSRGELLIAMPLAIVVLPFFEELIFRGFLQPLLVQNLGDRGGVVATSVVFGALHGASAFLPIFGLSLILGGVMLRTQRLIGSFSVHALHNALMLGLLFTIGDGLGYEAGPTP
jgi:membrane protease YdiL (CAAX protease family)